MRNNTETGLSCLYCSGAVHRIYLQGKFYQHVPVFFFLRTKQHHSERHITNSLLIADNQIWTPFSLLQSTWAAFFIFHTGWGLEAAALKCLVLSPAHVWSNSEILMSQDMDGASWSPGLAKHAHKRAFCFLTLADPCSAEDAHPRTDKLHVNLTFILVLTFCSTEWEQWVNRKMPECLTLSGKCLCFVLRVCNAESVVHSLRIVLALWKDKRMDKSCPCRELAAIQSRAMTPRGWTWALIFLLDSTAGSNKMCPESCNENHLGRLWWRYVFSWAGTCCGWEPHNHLWQWCCPFCALQGFLFLHFSSVNFSSAWEDSVCKWKRKNPSHA